MFLYARLVMDYLASNIFFSGEEIKKSVNQLPQKLTDLYACNYSIACCTVLILGLATKGSLRKS